MIFIVEHSGIQGFLDNSANSRNYRNYILKHATDFMFSNPIYW